MILTVTLNPALDLTYRLPVLRPARTNRVGAVLARAGGKGLNVARVLSALGEDVLATGLIGGPTGAAITADLAPRHSFVPIAAESRRTVTVVSTVDGTATVLNEPGPPVTAAEWRAFCAGYEALAAGASVVVLAGSLPPGVPVDGYAELIGRSAAPVVLDADGCALRHGMAAGPALVAPNLTELAGALGVDPADALAACRGLAVPAAVTVGADGAVLSTPDGVWRARPPSVVAGNPTGAGDAFTAALARGHARGDAWPAVLADAVALSAAAVAAPAAGEFDPVAYRRFRDLVTVEKDPAQ